MSSKEELTLARQMNSTTSTTKTQSWILPTEAKFIEAPASTLDAPSLGQAPGLDIPLYDYDEAASAETFRSERDQPSYAESYTNQRSARQPAGYEFDPEPANPFYKTSSKSSSSVSFNLNVGGKSSGFSYSL